MSQRDTTMALWKVISGGQTGVDHGALQAALDFGLQIGGWCPPGRVSERGLIPLDFPLVETPRERSRRALDVARSLRTEWNVRDSQATLVLWPTGISGAKTPQKLCSGSSWTERCARQMGRPLLRQDLRAANADQAVVEWIRSADIGVLNVAGPSETAWPGAETAGYTFLTSVFSRLGVSEPGR